MRGGRSASSAPSTERAAARRGCQATARARAPLAVIGSGALACRPSTLAPRWADALCQAGVPAALTVTLVSSGPSVTRSTAVPAALLQMGSDVKGLFPGGASSELSAAMAMSRLDPQASARA